MRVLRRIALALILLAGVPATAHAADYDAWSAAGSPALDRDAAVAVALADGRALLAGGSTPDSTGMFAPGASAELYDPAANAWSPAAPLSGPRYLASATVLLDGRVLVAGGSVKAGYWKTASTEIYDPAVGTWSAAAAHAQRTDGAPSGAARGRPCARVRRRRERQRHGCESVGRDLRPGKRPLVARRVDAARAGRRRRHPAARRARARRGRHRRCRCSAGPQRRRARQRGRL